MSITQNQVRIGVGEDHVIGVGKLLVPLDTRGLAGPRLLTRVEGQGENGLRVVDVWESQEALDKFAAQLVHVLAEIGMDAKPDIHQARTFVSA